MFAPVTAVPLQWRDLVEHRLFMGFMGRIKSEGYANRILVELEKRGRIVQRGGMFELSK
jgi:hypothetical protein